jgi:DNA transformation protein
MGEKGAKLSSEAAQSYERIIESLQPLGDITGKKMFGGYGIFESGTMFALVNSEGKIFFKADETNRWRFEEVEADRHARMPYYEVPDAILRDEVSLFEWAKESIELAHKSKKG